MTAAIHCFVSGRVQGVCFRAAAQERARDLGVTGWARNLRDGRVEVWAVGDEDALDAFRVWLGEGPPAARVDGVDTEAVTTAEVPADFAVR